MNKASINAVFKDWTPETWARFRGCYTEGDPGACWEWQGPINPAGYATFSTGGKSYSARKLIWLLAHPSVRTHPATLRFARSKCKNTECVNPIHVRRSSNYKGAKRGRAPIYCPQGHDIRSKDALYFRPGSKAGECRRCRLERQRRYRATEEAKARNREIQTKYRETNPKKDWREQALALLANSRRTP